MRDGSSSDVIALEHTAAALHLDSGSGENGLLVDVLFWYMLACCYGVQLIVCVPARSGKKGLTPIQLSRPTV